MTKDVLLKGLKKVAGSDKDKARLFADVIRDVIVEGLTEDGIVKIKGLGTFKVVEVMARKSVDVNTGAEIEIAAHRKVTFTPENQLADVVNEPLAHLEVINLGADGEAVAAEKKPVVEKKPVASAAKKPAVAKKAVAKKKPVVAEPIVEDNAKDEEAIRRLGADAESLKGILAMINGPANPAIPANPESPAIPEEPAIPANPAIPENPVMPTYEPAPAPTYQPTPQPTYQPVAPQPVAPQPAAYQPTTYQPIDLGPAPDNSKKVIRWIVAIAIILLLAGGGILCYLKKDDWFKKEKQETVIAKAPEKSEAEMREEIEKRKEEAFEATEDDTTYVYTGVEQPKKKQQQSTDNALAVIRVKEGDRLMSLSKQYYGHKMFWVYIYEANKDHLRSPNDLQLDMTLVIPRLDKKLTDVENEESVAAAMKLEAKYLGK